MSTQAHKALYRRWFEEVVTGRNVALADDLLADNYVMHFPGMPRPLDREGHKQLLGMFHSAFPDWRETVDLVVAEGDLVAQSAAQAVSVLPSVFSTTLTEPDQKTLEVSTEECGASSPTAAQWSSTRARRWSMRRATFPVRGTLARSRTHRRRYTSPMLRRSSGRCRSVVLRWCSIAMVRSVAKASGSPRICSRPATPTCVDISLEPRPGALVGVMQIEYAGIRYVVDGDRTAVFLDARDAEAFSAGSVTGAVRLAVEEVTQAKDDGRLHGRPQYAHRGRGRRRAPGADAPEAVAENAFHNVAFYAGSVDELFVALAATDS
jgi:hypothetical protein